MNKIAGSKLGNVQMKWPCECWRHMEGMRRLTVCDFLRYISNSGLPSRPQKDMPSAFTQYDADRAEHCSALPTSPYMCCTHKLPDCLGLRFQCWAPGGGTTPGAGNAGCAAGGCVRMKPMPASGNSALITPGVFRGLRPVMRGYTSSRK